MDKLINIDLYGDGSNGAKLRAEAIYCDRCEECSLYQRKRCAKITTLFRAGCPIGTINRYGYYTNRSKKYEELKTEVKNNEKYHKLKYPDSLIVERVGNDILLSLNYLFIKYDEEHFSLDVTLWSNANIVVIPSDKFTNDMILKICKYRPYTLMDHTEITAYRDKVVPNFLAELRDKFGDIYNRFVAEYPEYKDFKPNYIGRKAFLKTVNKDLEYEYGNPNTKYKFRIKGGKVIIENYNSALLPFGAKNARVEFEITDNMLIYITDNNQVTENTIFA